MNSRQVIYVAHLIEGYWVPKRIIEVGENPGVVMGELTKTLGRGMLVTKTGPYNPERTLQENFDEHIVHQLAHPPMKKLVKKDDKGRKVCQSCLEHAEKLLRCGRCKTIRYCSKECQSKHWRIHKDMCRPPESK